jgi:hypothetical protein
VQPFQGWLQALFYKDKFLGHGEVARVPDTNFASGRNSLANLKLKWILVFAIHKPPIVIRYPAP